jgi:hypothetical protein
MNLSIDDLGRIAPWLRAQSDRTLEVLFRTDEFFGDEGPFRQLTLYNAFGFALFLALVKTVVDVPIDLAVLKIDPLSPTMQAMSIILLLLSATVLGIGIYISARLVRVAADLVISMKAAYYLWAFSILVEVLIFPLRAGSREQLLAIETLSVDLDQAGEFLSSLPISFWVFGPLLVALTIWRLIRWTSAVRAIYAVATWRALVIVLLAEAITTYAQAAVFNPLYRQVINQSLGAT